MAFLNFVNSLGFVSTQSGINWGHSSGHVVNYDAYIPIRKNIIINNPGLIPRKSDQNTPFFVTWDNGVTMQMTFEGTQTINGVNYPKQLSSHPNKNDLGYYLRNRMKLFLPDGNLDSRIITLQDLNNYGTTGVNLTYTDRYYCSFK
ncbi:hypothetical protein [Cetobacterium sp.]|uniref:hypothetical protein n=1 Tax=Cetobacterium sp. TaxID=2071632 RepID=UPI003F2ECF07